MHTAQMAIPLDSTSGVPAFAREMNPETKMMSYGVGSSGLPAANSSWLMAAVKAKLGMAILCNLGRTPDALSRSHTQWPARCAQEGLDDYRSAWPKRRKLRRMRKLRKERATAQGHASRELTNYAGNYENTANGRITVSLEDGILGAQGSVYRPRDRLVDDQLLTFALDAEAVVPG
jgi:hypothetical protein